MTLRHAAALAVIGWYLMMPPPYWSKTNPRNAPLRQWTVFGRYDTAQECSDERTKIIRVQSMALLSDLAESVSDANRPSLSLDFKHAQCIAATTRASRKHSAPRPSKSELTQATAVMRQAMHHSLMYAVGQVHGGGH